MSKCICAISGIPLTISSQTGEDIPINLGYTPEFVHPIFHLTQQKLLGLYNLTCLNKANNTTKYLTYLAILHSSNLISYKTHFIFSPATLPIITKTITSLFLAISKIQTLPHEKAVKLFPSFLVTPENNSLESIPSLITEWNSVIGDLSSSYLSQKKSSSISSIESKILNLGIDKTSPLFYTYLGEWAEIVCEFPTFYTLTTSGERIKISEYWKSLIRKSLKRESLLNIPISDLVELYEHCLSSLDLSEDFTGFGTILLETLKRNTETTDDLFGFSILPPAHESITGGLKEITISDICLESLQKETEKPTRLKYPNLADFAAAMSRWLVQSTHTSTQSKNNQTGES